MSSSMMGAPFNAYGALLSGQMTAQSLDAQANIQQNNAAQAEESGQYNATRATMLANQKIGTSIAAYGAAGVTSDSGSVQDVLGAGAANAELDRLNILHGAHVKAINYNNQASMNRYGAQSALTGSYWQAAGALTGGAFQGLSNHDVSGGGGSGMSSEDAAMNSDITASGGSEGFASAGAGEGAGLSAADAAALA